MMSIGSEIRDYKMCFPTKADALAAASVMAGRTEQPQYQTVDAEGNPIDPPLLLNPDKMPYQDFSADGWVQLTPLGPLHVDIVQIGDVWETRPVMDESGTAVTPGILRLGWHGIIRYMKPAHNRASIDDMIPAAALTNVVEYDLGVELG